MSPSLLKYIYPLLLTSLRSLYHKTGFFYLGTQACLRDLFFFFYKGSPFVRPPGGFFYPSLLAVVSPQGAIPVLGGTLLVFPLSPVFCVFPFLFSFSQRGGEVLFFSFSGPREGGGVLPLKAPARTCFFSLCFLSQTPLCLSLFLGGRPPLSIFFWLFGCLLESPRTSSLGLFL